MKRAPDSMIKCICKNCINVSKNNTFDDPSS